MSENEKTARVLSVRDIHRGRVVHLTEESIVLPNGHAMELEIIRHPGASAIVPLTPEGDVILIRQYRHAAGGFIYEVPAGKLDKGEPPEECAARELTEEAGVVAGRMRRLASIVTAPGFADEVIHLYLATELTPARTSHEPSEVITLLKRPLAECLDMISRGEIIDGKTICALFLANKLVTEEIAAR
jgi:ADP-ribose pyrophosphatase